MKQNTESIELKINVAYDISVPRVITTTLADKIGYDLEDINDIVTVLNEVLLESKLTNPNNKVIIKFNIINNELEIDVMDEACANNHICNPKFNKNSNCLRKEKYYYKASKVLAEVNVHCHNSDEYYRYTTIKKQKTK